MLRFRMEAAPRAVSCRSGDDNAAVDVRRILHTDNDSDHVIVEKDRGLRHPPATQP